MDLPFVVHGHCTNQYTYKSVMDPHVDFHATPPKDIDREIDVTHGDDDAYTRIVIARVNIDAIGASNRYPEIDDLYPRSYANVRTHDHRKLEDKMKIRVVSRNVEYLSVYSGNT